MTVKENGIDKDVAGQTYKGLIMIEGDMKMNVNGNLISANYSIQHYYAPDVGLVLTTSSYGDVIELTSCEIK